MSPRRPVIETLSQQVRAGDRTALARAITLSESERPQDQTRSQTLLGGLLPATGKSIRLGITGTPGVGKSTLIDALGTKLIDEGHRVAVLSIDPTSSVSGGSILADKTRMLRLASNERAFIRPSPNATLAGGVAPHTRETILLCEAAGYDLVIVETVGVGQAEVAASRMVDFFLLLVHPAAGDELQGLKRGVMELADLVAINKADGEMLASAQTTLRDYNAALRFLPPKRAAWKTEAILTSAINGDGLDELWQRVRDHQAKLKASGERDQVRKEQALRWMWEIIERQLLTKFRESPKIQKRLKATETKLLRGSITAPQAAQELLGT